MREATMRDTEPVLPVLPPASVVVDLDHTIADSFWRDPLMVMGQWDTYYTESVKDEPFGWMLDLLHGYRDLGYKIVCVTGRPERWRQLTVNWMYRNGVAVDDLLMRRDDDHRPQAEVKPDLVEEYFEDLSSVAFAIEDREDVCAAYRRMGLNVLKVYARRETSDKERERAAGGAEDAPRQS
jgi:hypothetical protein